MGGEEKQRFTVQRELSFGHIITICITVAGMIIGYASLKTHVADIEREIFKDMRRVERVLEKNDIIVRSNSIQKERLETSLVYIRENIDEIRNELKMILLKIEKR